MGDKVNLKKELEKDEKIIRRQRYIIVGIVLFCIMICFVSGRIWYNWRRLSFLNKHLPEVASKSVIKWCKYYDMDWLKVFALIRTESNCKRYAKSRKGAIGYLQLIPSTFAMIQPRLRELGLRNFDIYTTDANIGAGTMFVRVLFNHYSDNWEDVVQIYNVGPKNWRKGMKADTHLKKWCISYTSYNNQWGKYLFGIQ